MQEFQAREGQFYQAVGHVKEESTVAGVFGIQINLTRLQRAAYHAATTKLKPIFRWNTVALQRLNN